jgi:hypothetical protein
MRSWCEDVLQCKVDREPVWHAYHSRVLKLRLGNLKARKFLRSLAMKQAVLRVKQLPAL